MKINLQKSVPKIRREILNSLRELPDRIENKGIIALILEYDIDPGGYALSVDTSSRFEPCNPEKGEYLTFADFLHDDWCRFDSQIFRGKAELVSHDGDHLESFSNEEGFRYELKGENKDKYYFEDEGDYFIQALGRMFLQIFEELKSKGSFRKLNLRENAIFYVQEMHYYFWEPEDSGWQERFLATKR